MLSAEHDLLVYDLGEGKPVALFVGGQILRNVQGRIRQFLEEEQHPASPGQQPAFVVCPLALGLAPWQAALYQAAYERAREAVEAEAREQRLYGSWN